jgi:hypothetical protein
MATEYEALYKEAPPPEEAIQVCVAPFDIIDNVPSMEEL